MYLKSVLQMASLMLHFRNGRTLVQRMRAGEPCDEVVLWDGTRISHPSGGGGLLEVVVELWLEHAYTAGFYRPADGGVIIDTGANVGIFAIQIARQNPRCRVIALGPFLGNFKYLEANVARACPETVTYCDVALGAGFSRGQTQAASSPSLDHVLRVDPAAADSTPVVPLSGLFDRALAQEIDFLKVDIEAPSTTSCRRFTGPAWPIQAYRDGVSRSNRARTLAPLHRVLTPTHEITVRPSKMEGCGILLARCRLAAADIPADFNTLQLQEFE